jgi:hypothetical protein
MESVYIAVRTDCLYEGGGGKCLQRGTEFLLKESRMIFVFKGLNLFIVYN